VTPLPLFSSFPFIHSPPPRPHSLPLLTMGALRSPRTPQPLRCPLSPHPQPSALSSLCGAPMFCGYHVAECPHAALRLYFQTGLCCPMGVPPPGRSPAGRLGGFLPLSVRWLQPHPETTEAALRRPPPRKSHKLLPSCHRGSFPVWPVSGLSPAPGGMPGGTFIPTPLSSPPFHTLRRLSSRLSFCPVLRRVNRRRHSLYSRAGTRTPVSRRSLSDQCPALEGRSSSPPPHPLPRRTVMGSPFETG